MALLLTLRDRTAPWLGVPHGKQRRFDCAQVLPIRQWLRGRSASILGASHLMPGLGLERTASLADIEPHRMFPSASQEEWRESTGTRLELRRMVDPWLSRYPTFAARCRLLRRVPSRRGVWPPGVQPFQVQWRCRGPIRPLEDPLHRAITL